MFVVGTHTVEVQIDNQGAPRTVGVRVSVDGRAVGTYEEAGWRPIGFGTVDDFFYLWSARRVTVVPTQAPPRSHQLSVDEDIVVAFGRGDGWLVVCETSVRLVKGGREVSRLDYGDVITTAHFDGRELVLLGPAGSDRRVRVSEEELRASE